MVLGSGNFFPPSVGSFQVPVAPPAVDPDEGEQVTVCFAADWLPFVVGALQQLALQATWAGDDTTVLQAQSRAQLLIAMFGSSGGGCEDAVCIKGLRYDADCDCILQTPPGGGSEVENPGADPRHADVFRYPPVDADDPRCQAAANMVRWISDLIDQVLGVIGAAGTAEGLLAIVVAATVELGPFAILIDLALGLCFLLFSAGATAIGDAFTNDAYDQLQCIFYCHIGVDGSVSAAQLAAIQADIADDIGGLVQTITDAMFFLMGEVGLANAGVVGDNPSADCDECDCAWSLTFLFDVSEDHWYTTLWLDGFAAGTYEAACCFQSTLDHAGGHQVLPIAIDLTMPAGSQLRAFTAAGFEGGFTAILWDGTYYNTYPPSVTNDVTAGTYTLTAYLVANPDTLCRFYTITISGDGDVPTIAS